MVQEKMGRRRRRQRRSRRRRNWIRRGSTVNVEEKEGLNYGERRGRVIKVRRDEVRGGVR